MLSNDKKFIVNIEVQWLKGEDKKNVFINIPVKELTDWQSINYKYPGEEKRYKELREKEYKEILSKFNESGLKWYITSEDVRPSGAKQKGMFLNIENKEEKCIYDIFWGISSVGTGLSWNQWKIGRGDLFAHPKMPWIYFTDSTWKKIKTPTFTSVTKF